MFTSIAYMSPVDKEIELTGRGTGKSPGITTQYGTVYSRPDQTRPDSVPYGRFKLLLTHVNKHATIGKTEQGRG